ncbi:MAG: glycerol kinase GlpK [Anaerolineae bacterium]|nr:glycerol kinase GlpK [Candidatus Roseilinea sp.]MDW8451375.1 glycerol kinase GlpK [Anaerolineae bacterium]
MFIAAIDQGTTSTRCILFNHEGQPVATAQQEHRQIYPQPGWVEHDPMEIWANAQSVFAEALARANARSADIAAIGITNQRETTIVWEKATGKPIYNAIVWQDTRTASICAELAKDGGQDRYRAKTGLPLATYFSGPKLKWLLDNIPNARARAQNGELLFGTVDTWLIWNATGQHVTDVTNAGRTMLMNLATLDWDEDILRDFDIPRAMLPRIASSSEVYGATREGVPVAGDMGDQHAALFGQTCFTPGEAKNTYGTGCFMLMNTGEVPVPSSNGLLTTMGYKLGDAKPVYALEGSIAITGALVQWLRDNLGLIRQSNEIEALARSVEDNGGIYFVPAFSGLYAPYWRDDARGVIAGLTRYVNKGHLARAALEATAYQTRDVLDAMNRDIQASLEIRDWRLSNQSPISNLQSLKVDGGMVHNELLMQFQADILNVPVIRPTVSETTALGAAYAAGLAVGYWRNVEDLRANWRADKTWQPSMDDATRDRLYRGWQKAVTRTFGWVE